MPPKDIDIPTVNIGGFRTASINRKALALRMVNDCTSAKCDPSSLPKLVFSSNGQGVALAGTDVAFAAAMQQADIIHADGASIVFASQLTRHALPERIATTDFFHDAAQIAQEHGLNFYFLGATEDQNRRAVEAVRRLYPRLNIVGQRNGFFKKNETVSICNEIKRLGTDVLWVALGKPAQEFWSVDNQTNLAGVGWIKTCGGLYAFLAGDAPRAPAWMQRFGLEWLYRSLKEPKRLGWRYITTNPYSAYRLLKHTEITRWRTFS